MLQILWERHKNPFSWMLRPVFTVVLIYGVWLHDWLAIWAAVIGLATSWFWFPKPKKIPSWAEKFIDKEDEWLHGLKKGGTKEVAWTVLAIVVVVIWIYALWVHNVVASAGMLGFIVGAKLVWSAMLERSVAKPLTILVFGSYAVATAVLILVLWLMR